MSAAAWRRHLEQLLEDRIGRGRFRASEEELRSSETSDWLSSLEKAAACLAVKP